MSSKVLPGDAGAARPFAWRKVDAERETARQVASDVAREYEVRIVRLEEEWKERVAQARAAGVEEGVDIGRSAASAELQPVIERLARTIEEISQLRAGLRKEAERDLVRLSLAIARRVVHREVAVDPDVLHGLVLAALEKLQAQEICRVRVHPAHAAAVSAALPPRSGGSPIEVIPDPSFPPGGVVFETSRGNLDASIDTQLQEIERGLADRLQRMG